MAVPLWIVCANELNAAYAADGYARINGAALLTTTYGVGELSALNGVMGAKAERSVIFHLVGAPSTRVQRQGLVSHHTLGDGRYGEFTPLSAAATCVSTILTPDNVVPELERVIREALFARMPAYIQVPLDFAKMPVAGTPTKGVPLAAIPRTPSNPRELAAALAAITERLRAAASVVALPTTLMSRYGLQGALDRLLRAHSIPFATLSSDKAVLSEASPLFLGIYGGRRSTPSSVTAQVESADAILDIGGIILEDFATGLWTTQLAPSKLITLGDHFVRVGNQLFVDLHLADVLDALTAATLPRWSESPTPTPVAPLQLAGEGAEPTSSAALYPRLQRMLRPGDTIVAEQGSCMFHLGGLRLPDGVGFQSQTLWGSIGWATAATLGVTMAKAAGRTILVTGDGSHQLTANEIGVMGRYGAKPIIFVLRNDIYGVEDVLSEVGLSYDDLARWNYVQIPAAMGCTGWFAAHARTIAELDAAIATAQTHDGGSYIVVDIPQAESVPLPKAVQDHLYKP